MIICFRGYMSIPGLFARGQEAGRQFPLGIRWSDALQRRGPVPELATLVRGDIDRLSRETVSDLPFCSSICIVFLDYLATYFPVLRTVYLGSVY